MADQRATIVPLTETQIRMILDKIGDGMEYSADKVVATTQAALSVALQVIAEREHRRTPAPVQPTTAETR